MNFEELINFPLLKTEHLEITVSSILAVVLILTATFLALRVIRSFFKRYINKNDAERRSYWSVYLILRYVVWVVIIVVILETSGVKVSILLASITALLVGVGFGIQQLFSDFASGIVLIFERNLQINDILNKK